MLRSIAVSGGRLPPTDPVAIFNAVEAAWWIGLGIALFTVRVRPEAAFLRLPLFAVLVLFGVSDVVEIWSGAWWRPWWLAVWKIACGVAMPGLALLWFRRR